MEKHPLLLIGDSPAGYSGLGRILRDVALRIHTHLGDVFDLATLGLGAPPSTTLPFDQYHAPSANEWVMRDLPWVWEKHAKGHVGTIFSLWDISRLLWMAYPDQCPDPEVKKFLLNFKGKKWGYPAIDGCGPTGGMPTLLKDALTKFDRVLNYTNFSAKITGYPDVCTHGIDTKVFYPRDNAQEFVEKTFSMKLEKDEKLIGIVATNQPRKDWALAFGTLALLKRRGVKARVWIHTDTDMRHWDLKALYVDFGLAPEIKVFLTPFGLPDETMAELYSAADVTIGIGPEGFGYPIAESLCCGTPCVTGSYGGQSDFVPRSMMVDPIAFRYEGIFAIQRPVYDAADFAIRIEAIIRDQIDYTKPVCSWDSIWPSWEKWFRDGL